MTEPFNRERHKIGIPVRPFLYTVDQLAVMLDLPKQELHENYFFYEGRSVGLRPKNKMVTRNIAPPDMHPEWRVLEKEFIRWMKVKGFRHYEISSFKE